MPIIEFITPLLLQDEATKTTFTTVALPHLNSLLRGEPGMIKNLYGVMIEENGVSGDLFKPALALEWVTEENFHSFLTNEDFRNFGAMIKPLAAAKPQPQLYKTTTSPQAVFGAAVTEVFRVKIPSGAQLAIVTAAWERLIAATKASNGIVETLSGTSLNLEEELFVGVLGWSSLDAREKSKQADGVVIARSLFHEIDAVSSFVVSFNA